ncbi:MAG: hypothetical protein ABI990_06680, partial [Actinomycetota bacterium]
SAVFGGSLPAQIWNRFMSEAVKRLPVKDFVYPQFTGHTVSSPYSYIPYAPSTTTTTTQTPQAPAPKQPTPAPTPPAPPLTPSPPPAPPTATIGGNGQ